MYEKTIWMYWENKKGSKKPAYLDLCLETIKCHKGSFEIKLLDENTIHDYIELPPVANRLKQLAHKADYIRFLLLYKYGGIWLDSDIILMRNIDDSVIRQLEDYDYVGYGFEYGKPSINFMATQKGCVLLEKQLEKIEEVLQKKLSRSFFGRKIKIGWSEIGYDIMWPMAKEYKYFHHDFNMFAPTLWSDHEEFAKEDVEIEKYLAHNPFATMLFNKMMSDSYKDLDAESILNGNSLLSKLFNSALRNC